MILSFLSFSGYIRYRPECLFCVKTMCLCPWHVVFFRKTCFGTFIIRLFYLILRYGYNTLSLAACFVCAVHYAYSWHTFLHVTVFSPYVSEETLSDVVFCPCGCACMHMTAIERRIQSYKNDSIKPSFLPDKVFWH